jgi:hypothetical protein
MADSAEQPARYSVDRLPAVTDQIRRYVARGKQLGLGREVLDALEDIVDSLEARPLEWGDPLYATKLEGGRVLRGMRFPFIVQYVAYQEPRVVCILKLRAFPHHPLEAE